MTTKNTFSSARRALALEQRILFDGAGAAAGADAIDGDIDYQVDTKPQSHQDPQQQRVAQLPMPFGARLFAAPMAMFAEGVVPPFELDGAQKLGEPVKVGEDGDENGNPQGVSEGIELGEGATSITVRVESGKLWLGQEVVAEAGQTVFIDSAEDLAALTYEYTGDSETGDTDVLRITATVNGDEKYYYRDIAIAPQNDAPELEPLGDEKYHIVVNEGDVFTFDAATPMEGKDEVNSVYQGDLQLSDPDNSPEQVIVKITGKPGLGYLTLDGVRIAEGATFSLADIGKLTYHPEGDLTDRNPTPDSFTINIDDGAGGLLEDQTVSILINPVNKAPSISGSLVLIEGEMNQIAFTGASQGFLSALGSRGDEAKINDPDGGEHNITITSIPEYIDLYYGEKKVELNDTIENADPKLFSVKINYEKLEKSDDKKNLLDKGHRINASIGMSIEDDGGHNKAPITIEDGSLDIIILPNNIEPELTENGPIHFGPDSAEGSDGKGSSIQITNKWLQLTDPDASEKQLVYKLTSVPDNGIDTPKGYLSLGINGKALDVGSIITQKDIDEGRLYYHARKAGDPLEYTFAFEVTDGGKTVVFDENGNAKEAREGGIYEGDALKKHEFTINYYSQTEPGKEVYPDGVEWVGPGALSDITFDSQAVLESGEGNFQGWLKGAGGAAVEGDPESIIYRITSQPNNGQILLNGKPLELYSTFTQAQVNDGEITFRHDGSESFTTDFGLDVTNGVSTKTVADTSITITPQNDSPTATPVTELVAEGQAVFIDVKLADVDGEGEKTGEGYATVNELRYKVVAQEDQALNGTLYLAPKGIDVSEIHKGNIPGDWTALSLGSEVSHEDYKGKALVYVHDDSETHKAQFNIIPLDNSDTFDGALPTEKNESSEGLAALVDITITPLNDAPIFVGKVEATGDNAIYEGEEITIGGKETDQYHLKYTDSDNNERQRQYRVTAAPEHGTLSLNGKALGVGSVFTQADLDSGTAITYEHDGSGNYEDSFDYVVSDGDWTVNENSEGATNTKEHNTEKGIYEQGTSKSEIKPSTYEIHIKPANDAPEIKVDSKGPIGVSSREEGTSLGDFTLTDPDKKEDEDAKPVDAGHYEDFVRVTVEVQNGVDLLLEYDTVADVQVVEEAGGKLVFQGEVDKVEALLNSVTVKVGADASTLVTEAKIKVTVDDRIYKDDGNFGLKLKEGKPYANGGDINEGGKAITEANNTASVVIDVHASHTNKAPEFTGNQPKEVTVNEDGHTAQGQTSTGNRSLLEIQTQYTDKDDFGNANNTLTLEVGPHGRLFLSETGKSLPGSLQLIGGEIGTSTVTLQGTKVDINAALNSIYYTSEKNFNGKDELKITINDGGNMGDGDHEGEVGIAEKTVDITITPVNDAPELDETIKDLHGGFITLTGQHVFPAISFTDPDREKGFDEDTGYQSAKEGHEYTIILKAEVEGEPFGKITVADADGISFGETSTNNTGEVTITGTYEKLQSALAEGKVIYTPGEGEENKNIEFTITVNDNGDGGVELGGIGEGLSDSVSFTFQRTDVNDAPEFTLKKDGPTHVEGGNPTLLDPGAKVIDEELDLFSGNGGSWAGAVLTVQRGKLEGDELVADANVGDLFGVTDLGIGEVVNENGILTITFNEDATSEKVQTVLRSITYKNNESNEALKAYGDKAEVNILYSMKDGNSNVIDDQGGGNGEGQNQGTGGEKTGFGSVTVTINRQVVAEDDTDTVEEDGGPITGDLTPEGNEQQDRDPDTNQTIKVVEVTGGTLGDDEVITVEGEYGTLVVQPNGEYTYTLDNSNLKVQELLSNETLTETFTYKVSDDQGAFSTFDTADLEITITGKDDGVTMDVPEGDEGDYTVKESGIVNGTTEGTGHTLENKEFTLKALDGLHETEALVVAGTTLNREQVEKLSEAPQTIPTDYGNIILKGYSQAPDGTITITYDYELTKKSTGDEAQDEIKIIAKDRGNKAGDGFDTVEATIIVKIIDDAPIPENDSNTVSSGGQVSANVLDNDKPGADGWKQVDEVDAPVVGVVGSKGEATTDGDGNFVVVGEYGTLTLEPNGKYTYQANPDTPDGKKDKFTYTVQDGDGDEKTATLTITIDTVEVPETTTVGTVYEAGLEDGSNSEQSKSVTASLNLPEGQSVVDPTKVLESEYGELRFDENGNYTYTLTEAPKVAGSGNNEITDTFKYIAQDEFGNTVENTITITIVDDIPTPVADTNAVESGKTLDVKAEDGVLENDNPGADGWANGEKALIGVVAGDKVGEFTPVGNVGATITGQHGTLILQADGSYTYVAKPNAPEDAEDVFTYTIEDGDGDQVSTTLTITIGEVIPDEIDKPEGTVYEKDLRDGGTAQTQGEVPFPEDGGIQEQTYTSDYGTLEIDEDGNYTYTLTTAPKEVGEGKNETTDTFTYKYIDKHGNTVENTVTIIIVDDVPEAVADEATVSVGKTVSGNVTENDISGADGWAVNKVTTVGEFEGDHGTLELNADGTYTYTPNAEAKNGDVDEFTYTVVDADGDKSTATLTITIVDSQLPIAEDDSHTIPQGGSITDNVLDNDTDPDGSTLTVTEVNGVPLNPDGNTEIEIPGKGTLVITPDGAFTFTPEGSFSGEVPPIEYTTTNEKGDEAKANIIITVTPAPLPPVAVPDSNVITEGEKATGNILDNDYDPDGDDKDLVVTEITVDGKKTPVDGETEVEIPGKGTLVITPDGKYTFTPNDGYIGNVPPIEYEIIDSDGETDTSELLITVIPDPLAGQHPTANPDYAVTDQGEPISGKNILDNDSEEVTVTKLIVKGEEYQPGQTITIEGKGEITINKNGTYTFTPDKDFSGEFPVIDYEVENSQGGQASSTLTITVIPGEQEAPKPQLPVARPDKDVIKRKETATGNVLDNDSEGVTVTEFTVNGDSETYTPGDTVTIEDAGTITVKENGKYTFKPNEDYIGKVPTIYYTVEDGEENETSSTLDITVIPEEPVNNFPPVANLDYQEIPQGEIAEGNVTTNDKDPEGEDLTVTKVTVQGKTYGPDEEITIKNVGKITVEKDGSYTFTPEEGFVGKVPTITYEVTDGKGGYETSTLDITVTPKEPEVLGPIANDDFARTKVNTSVDGNILDNDSKDTTIESINGEPFTPEETITLDEGALVAYADGSYTFTPNEDWHGVVPAIEYTVVDEDGKTAKAKLHITVEPEVIDVPVDNTVLAVPDVKTTEMNKTATGNILENDITTGEVTITKIDGKEFGEDGKITIEFEDEGTITIDENGNYTFTPKDGYVGKVPTINYSIKDGNGKEDSSTLTITVLPKSETKPDPKPETPRPDPKPEPQPEPQPEPEVPSPEPEAPELEPELPSPEPDTPDIEQPLQPETPESRPDTPEQPELRPQDDLNHVDYNPVEVPSSKPSELAMSEPSHSPLQPKNVLLSDQVQDPSVFFEGSISDKIQRMQVPLHPIVYVNRQVQESQAERALNDVASFSNPSAVTPGEIGSISIGAGLGQDQNIFVVHAVRGTQDQAQSLELQVSGRLSRVSLSSDGELATPGLFSENTGLEGGADSEAEAGADAEVDTPEPELELEQEGALSFSQQLQNSREWVMDMPLFVMAELD